MQAGLSLKCAVCKQLSFAPDYYAGFYDSLHAGYFWIIFKSRVLAQLSLLKFLITLATIECVYQAELPYNHIKVVAARPYIQNIKTNIGSAT